MNAHVHAGPLFALHLRCWAWRPVPTAWQCVVKPSMQLVAGHKYEGGGVS